MAYTTVTRRRGIQSHRSMGVWGRVRLMGLGRNWASDMEIHSRELGRGFKQYQ